MNLGGQAYGEERLTRNANHNDGEHKCFEREVVQCKVDDEGCHGRGCGPARVVQIELSVINFHMLLNLSLKW